MKLFTSSAAFWLMLFFVQNCHACEQCVYIGGFWGYQCEGGFEDGGYYCVQGQPGKQCQIYYTDCYDPNYCDPECPASYKPARPEQQRHGQWLIAQSVQFLERVKRGEWAGSTIYLDRHCPVAKAISRRKGSHFQVHDTTIVIN